MDPPQHPIPVPGAIVVGTAYDLALWIIQKVEKFSKSYRFSVEQRLMDGALDLLLLLVEAAYRKDKRGGRLPPPVFRPRSPRRDPATWRPGAPATAAPRARRPIPGS
jgi:hypothetical protein